VRIGHDESQFAPSAQQLIGTPFLHAIGDLPAVCL
jgi:hypothetical protein